MRRKTTLIPGNDGHAQSQSHPRRLKTSGNHKNTISPSDPSNGVNIPWNYRLQPALSLLALCPLHLFLNFCLQHLFSIKSLSKQTFPENVWEKLGAARSAPLTFLTGRCPLVLSTAFHGPLRMEQLGSWITLKFQKQGMQKSLFSPLQQQTRGCGVPPLVTRGF